MFKQTLIGSLQLDLAKTQDLSEDEMNDVLDRLNAIQHYIEDSEILDSLRFVIAEIESADELMAASARVANEFLILNYEDNEVQVQREAVWNKKDYKLVYSSVWSDLLKIMNSCNLIKGTLEEQKCAFNKYSRRYLDRVKKYIDVDRCHACSFESSMESSEYFRELIESSVENRKARGNQYADYCFDTIISLIGTNN